MADFKVQRGETSLAAGVLSATITAGVDYDAPASLSSAFIRVVGHMKMGTGSTSSDFGGRGDRASAYISDPANLLTSITFQRADASTNAILIAWEIIEYIGPAGGANEFIVRAHGTDGFSTTDLTEDTGTVSGVVDDADVVPFITSVRTSTGSGRAEWGSLTCTAEWIAASDIVRFERGTHGDNTLDLSYAVVEFTGSNWSVQRHVHTVAANDTTETSSISTPVADIAKAFCHFQHRTDSVGATEHVSFNAWLSSTSQLSVKTPTGAGTTNNIIVAWIVENTQTGGTPMNVQRYTGTRTAGAQPEPDAWTHTITAVALLSEASVMGESSIGGPNNTDGCHSLLTFRLTSTTELTLTRARNLETREWYAEIVEWPTAGSGGGGDPTFEPAWAAISNGVIQPGMAA